MTRHTTTILLPIIIGSLFLGANAQERSKMDPKILRDWPAPGKLQQRVQSLGQDRDRVVGKLSDDFRREQTYNTRPVMLDALRRRIGQSFQQREAQYDEIRMRLNQLEQALANKHREPPATPEPLIKLPEPKPLGTTPKVPSDPAPTDPVPADSDEASTPPTIPAPQLTEPPEPDPTTNPSPTIVTETAVDRIALADSLFASHQLDIALKLYQELAIEKQTKEDMVWIHYQIGSSSRRLKNYDQARKHYRIVAGQQDAGLYQKLSKWWLDTIQRRLSYQQEQTGLQTFLDQMGVSNVAASN